MVQFVSYNCNSVRNNSEIVKAILKNSDILFLQELMLSKSDLPLLHDFDDDFRNVAFVRDRESEGINEGRPTRGVAIFYRKELASFITPVLVDDSVIGIVLEYNNHKFLFMNVYLPCDLQNSDALDKYRNALASLQAIVREQNINDVVIVGDMNADPFKGRFWKELSFFCKSLSLSVLDEHLPGDSFTYLCPAKNSTSWLDHILGTVSVAKQISNVHIDHGIAIFDHFPVCFDFSFPQEHNHCRDDVVSTGEFVNWNRISSLDEDDIKNGIDKCILSRNMLDHEVFRCTNVNCKEESHARMLDGIFIDMKCILLESTAEFRYTPRRKFRVIPGWNDEVKQFYAVARDTFLSWKRKGRPLSGVLCDRMKTSRSVFKRTLKKCKENEESIRKEKLLKNLNDKQYKEFWREATKSKNHNSTQTNIIDRETDSFNICNLFSDKYSKIFNKRQKDVCERNCNLRMNEKDRQWIILKFSKDDIQRAIKKLKHNVGMDNIHSNHFKMCSDLFTEMISMLFSSFVIHGYIPIPMLRGTITPTIKDKFGDHSRSDNYRPIMSSSVFLKLFEYCLLERIGPFVKLNSRQHGFRSNYSTSSACLVLKETILNYVKSNSDVYACFIDVSKAFDSVNHDILMKQLLKCGIPGIFVNLIHYWYDNQWVNVKFLSCISEDWKIGNGVRQGGVLSGLLFGIYIDALIDRISAMNVGCKLGIVSSNIIAYADDLVLLAPSTKALQMLIDGALDGARSLDLEFNDKKTKCMVFRSSNSCCKRAVVTPFNMDGKPIEFVTSFKYLGFVVTSNLNNKEDIDRVRGKFYSEFNSILRNFNFADQKVKLFLFKQYCLQFYGSELWIGSGGASGALKQFAIGYHKAIKKLLNLSYHESNHFACQEAQLLTFKHLLNRIKIMATYRLISRPCEFIRQIMLYMNVSSALMREVHLILEDDYDIDSLLDNDFEAINSRILFKQNHEKQMREVWLIV